LLRATDGQRLQQQRALADAGIAADQHHAAIDQAAAERAVEFADAGRHPVFFARLDLGQILQFGGRPPARLEALLAGAFSATVSTSVFHCPQPGHCPATWAGRTAFGAA
jgi:hypothetical protein